MANEQTSVPLFVADTILTAAQQNISAATGVPVFATTVTRDAAFGGANKALAEGQLCYLSATDVVQYYDGAAWATVGPAATGAWAAWTPTFTNLTVGNGTLTARYIQSNKTVNYSLHFVFGSTSSISGTTTISLPVTAASTAASQAAVISVWYLDAGVDTYFGQSNPDDRTTTNFRLNVGGGTTTLLTVTTNVNATSPFTWTTSDAIYVSGMYEGV